MDVSGPTMDLQRTGMDRNGPTMDRWTYK